jgi:hypothetical protein
MPSPRTIRRRNRRFSNLTIRHQAAIHLRVERLTDVYISSADDERNPPETGIMERELERVKNARLFLIPASEVRAVTLPPGWRNFGSGELRSCCKPRLAAEAKRVYAFQCQVPVFGPTPTFTSRRDDRAPNAL